MNVRSPNTQAKHVLEDANKAGRKRGKIVLEEYYIFIRA